MDFPLTLTLESTSEQATEALAVRLAPLLKVGDLLALVGDLGTGKSVLARRLVRSLMGNDVLDVPSPTFTLVQAYEGKDITVWHSDLYRLEGSEDVYELGFEEALSHAVLLVEWPDRLPEEFHAGSLIISFQQAADSRLITLRGNEQWAQRLKGLYDDR